MKEDFQSYIYAEKYLKYLYQRAAALAPNTNEKNILLTFAEESQRYSDYLNYFYKNEYGLGYDPIISELSVPNNYYELLTEIEKRELESYLAYRQYTYFQQNYELQETLRSISDGKLAHLLTIQGILINLNHLD